MPSTWEITPGQQKLKTQKEATHAYNSRWSNARENSHVLSNLASPFYNYFENQHVILYEKNHRHGMWGSGDSSINEVMVLCHLFVYTYNYVITEDNPYSRIFLLDAV